MIFDNIIVAHETTHSMKNRNYGKIGLLAAKLDMSKAYDRVEWDFLEGLMGAMGFASRWIHLIMACVRSVSYSLVINGKQQGHVVPFRGLRQGDPLSPYLFLICAEGLVCLMRNAIKKGFLQGVTVANKGPKVSHLFFTDDSLFFCRAIKADCETMVNILETYKRASGQEVNLGKLAIFFSRNTTDEDKNMAMEILGIRRSLEHESYLGLPMLFGRSKAKELRYIREKLWSRNRGWNGRLLSQAGRATMIQAIG